MVEITNFHKNYVSSIVNFYRMEDMLPSHSYKFQPLTANNFHRLILEEDPFGGSFDSRGFFLVLEDEKLIGVARAQINRQFVKTQGENVGFISPEWPWSPMGFAVHPDYRRKGIGTMLLEKCLEYLCGEEMDLVQTSTDKACISRMSFLSKHGFKNWGKQIVFMERDLSKPISEPVLPKGYSFKEFQLGEEDELTECSNEIFKDEWLFMPRSVAGFANFYEKHPNFNPSGLFHIIHKDRIVGFVWNLISNEYIGYSGIKMGFLDVLGIAKEHRRKGLGTALVAKSLLWHRKNGMKYVDLNTHSTIAIKFYEKCDFKVVREWVTLRRPI